MEEVHSRSVSPLQAYATARLSGIAGPDWLDSQTLEQAVWATEMLGAQLEFGDSKQANDLTSDDRDLAGRTGFTFTSRGEAGMREALYHRQEEFRRKTGRQPLRRNVFGRLFESVASRKTAKDPGDIKRILREHLFDTVEMAEGATLLDGVLFKRRLHSVASLAKESGHDPRTLRNVLIARGVMAREGRFHVFDAELGRQIAATVRRVVHVTHLAKALNSSKPQAFGLLDDRILLSIATGEAGGPGHTQKGVDALSVAEFLATLAAAARPVHTVPAGMTPIAKAAEKTKTTCTEIIHLILGGYISDLVTLSSEWGYAALHVNPDEVRASVPIPGLSPSMAAGRVRWPVDTIWALMKEREEGPRLQSTLVTSPNGRHQFRRIAPATIEGFQASYGNTRDIAAARNIERMTLERRLQSAHIHPAISDKEVGIDLYLLKDIDAKIQRSQLTMTVA